MDSLFCQFEGPQYFILSSNVPELLYYSHFPAVILMAIVSIFLFLQRKQNLSAYFLLTAFLLASLWLLVDVVIWASNRSDINIFLWFLQVITEPAIYVAAFYAGFTFVFKKLPPLLVNTFFVLLLLPLFLLGPTSYDLLNIDLRSCNATEGPIALYYTYFVEVVSLLGIVGVYLLTKLKFSHLNSGANNYFTPGLILFLITFTSGNVVGSITGDWNIAQYGLFSIPFFVGVLAYITVRFKSFDIKIVSAQVLTVFLIVIVLAQFTYTSSTMSFILNTIALILISASGYYLIRSVGQEVKRKEELQILSDNLAKANEKLTEMDKQKSEFISIASHQLRTPLTAIKGYLSLLLEGSYGKLQKDVDDVVNKIYSVNDRLAHLVEDLLNVSRIEAGRIQYNFQGVHLADILTELHDMFSMTARNKGLEFTLELPKPAIPMIIADPNKIKEISSNLIDNAIKYTPTGSVTITLSEVAGNARIVIADTGIGIKPEDKEHLFSKFVRSKETSRMVVGGAGLGLFVGKSFVLAHKGNIWAESDGPGKGSRFIIELPIKNPELTIGTVDKKQES